MDASIDKEAAAVLNQIPEEGATVTHLAAATGFDPAHVEVAVGRLRNLKLIEQTEQTVRLTPFVQKARSLFKFVA